MFLWSPKRGVWRSRSSLALSGLAAPRIRTGAGLRESRATCAKAGLVHGGVTCAAPPFANHTHWLRISWRRSPTPLPHYKCFRGWPRIFSPRLAIFPASWAHYERKPSTRFCWSNPQLGRPWAASWKCFSPLDPVCTLTGCPLFAPTRPPTQPQRCLACWCRCDGQGHGVVQGGEDMGFDQLSLGASLNVHAPRVSN